MPKLKKLFIFLICFFAFLCMNCDKEKEMDGYIEFNLDVEIRIDNNSSMDLHISFYPNTFTSKYRRVTYIYNDVCVEKGESVSYIINFKYYEKYGEYYYDVYDGPHPDIEVKKIIFSKMDTGDLIKEVDNINKLIIRLGSVLNYFLEITDEILSTQGE